MREHLDGHLRQAEFALKIVSNFACLAGTPAHDAVREALARVGEARAWVRQGLAVETPALRPAEPAMQSVAERRRVVHRRMARLAP